MKNILNIMMNKQKLTEYIQIMRLKRFWKMNILEYFTLPDLSTTYKKSGN
jgi:hypothetical protein